MFSLEDALSSMLDANYGKYATVEENLIKIKFKINERLKNFNEVSFKYIFKEKTSTVLIIFKSTAEKSENKIFWRLNGKEKFHHLRITDDLDGALTDHCQHFLEKCIEKGESGILYTSERKRTLNIRDLANDDGEHLLMLAVMENCLDDVNMLLKFDFDLDAFFIIKDDYKTLIDVAWEKYLDAEDDDTKAASNKIMLSLLNTNARYPDKFESNYESASKEVKKFVKDCEELHKFVKLDDINSLKEGISSLPNLCHIYDRKNVSLMTLTLELKRFETKDFLSSSGVYPGFDESENVASFLQKFEDSRRSMDAEYNRINAKELPETHVLNLISKSRIGNYDNRRNERRECIEEAYEILDKHDGCRKVLQVVATCKGLKIFFDFKNDSTFYFDPTDSITTTGSTLQSGIIQIGVRGLLEESTRFKVIGVLAHELCHLAMNMTYFNVYNPYRMGEFENKSKERFCEIVYKECEKEKDFEDIVGSVFLNYDGSKHNLELIVRPYHMIMHYHKEPQNLDKCKQKYPQLFKYVEDVIEPDMVEALPILKKLHDDDQKVKFTELTEIMKAKILHDKFLFQGEETSIFEIIGNDEEILKRLTSNQIKNILLDKGFRLGEVCKGSAKYGYIERKFVKLGDSGSIINFEGIMSKVEISRIFALTGKAGDGKTTTFEDLTRKLKKSNKTFWVSFIKLRKFREIFEKLNSVENLNLDNIFELFCDILLPNISKKKIKADSDFEVQVFKKLFNNKKVIFLLDGVDEICPKFNKFVIKVLNILKQTENQLWISTRPQHVEEIQNALNVEVFALDPYDREERDKLINTILKSFKNPGQIDNDVEKLNSFFESFQDFNNPLLIIITVELYVNKVINLAIRVVNRFGVYETLVNEQMDKKEQDVDKAERRLFKSFSLFHVHQALALKFLFDDKDIKDLSIMQRWEVEKVHWNAEKIQRFGFVIVDLSFQQTGDRNSIDFIHYTIAEFLITQFIIENIFGVSHFKDEEIEKVFKLLKIIEPQWNENSFLLSFLNNHWDPTRKVLHSRMKELIESEIRKLIANETQNNYQNLKSLQFWCPFLKNEPEILKKLWEVEQSKPLFHKLLLSRPILGQSNNLNILEFVNNCLGENWQDILNKSDEKLVIDGEDENFEEHGSLTLEYNVYERVDSKKYFRNFYKLLAMVESLFTPIEKEIFRDKLTYIFHDEIYGNYYKKCYAKIMKIYKNDHKLLEIILNRIVMYVAEVNDLTCFREILEGFYKNDREKIRAFLFSNFTMSNIMIRIGRIYRNRNDIFEVKFKFFIDLCIEYKNSWDEVQNLFLSYFGILQILRVMPDDFFSTFIDYMRKIFGSKRERMFEYIRKSEVYLDGQPIFRLETFLIEFSENDEAFVKEGMRNLLYRENEDFQSDLHDYTEDSIKDFQNILELYKKYENFPCEYEIFFKSWKILSQIFFRMSNVSYPILLQFIENMFKLDKKQFIENIEYNHRNRNLISSEDTFNFFEKFLGDFFDDENDRKACMRKIILTYPKFYDILTSYIHDAIKFERIKRIFNKYLTTFELQQEFSSQSVIFRAFNSNYAIECYQNLVKLMKEIFEGNEDMIEDCKPDFEAIIALIRNEKEFKIFEKVLNGYYGNDFAKVRAFIGKILFVDINLLPYLLLEDIDKQKSTSNFQHLKRIFIQYKKPDDELSAVFSFGQNLLAIFGNAHHEVCQEFQEFLYEIFASDSSYIFECLNYDEGFLLIKKPKNLKLFEELLIKLFKTNKNQIKKAMRNILFKDYGKRLDPLLSLAKIKPLNDFLNIIEIYKTYKNSWTDLQNLFASKPFDAEIFRELTVETYPLFKEFIKEVFESDKRCLCKIKLGINKENNKMQYYSKEDENYFYEDFKTFLEHERENLNTSAGNSSNCVVA